MKKQGLSDGFTRTELDAIIKRLGGERGARKLLCGELMVSDQAWRTEDGVICLSVVTDGTTGSNWIERLKMRGFRVGRHARDLLRSVDFKPTSGRVIDLAILTGKMFAEDERTTENIRREAHRRNLTNPDPEAACLIREKLTNQHIKAMDLWSIITMHEPIKDPAGDLRLFRVYPDDAERCLRACRVTATTRWHRGRGFAFVVG